MAVWMGITRRELGARDEHDPGDEKPGAVSGMGTVHRSLRGLTSGGVYPVAD